MDATKEFGSDIVNRLKSTIRQRLSARHVPTLILPIKEIPYTVNGKKVIEFIPSFCINNQKILKFLS